MATSTVTGIDLQDRGIAGAPQSLVQREMGTDNTSAVDPILQESQDADSTVPDGGYGWVVIAGCSVMTWWFVGTSYSWGVIQTALVGEGLATPAVLSYVGSLGPALMALFATMNSRLIRFLGVRNGGLLGIGLLGLANILSGFAVGNVGALFATGGVLMGMGMGLCFMVVSATPAQWFMKRRGLANGIVFAGGGLGGAVTSFTLDALIQHVGPAWTYRILGLATLISGLPAAWFVKERIPLKKAGLVEWRLFRNPTFILVFIAGAVATFPLFIPPFFIPLYATSMGLSSASGAGLVAGFNFSSAVGRIVSGMLCDVIGPVNSLFLSLALTALSMLALWPASTGLASLAAFAVINGMANGAFFSTMPTVVGNVFGSARVATAMSMIVTSWAAGYLMGSPIAGYLLEAYGGERGGLQPYRPAMYYGGSMALGATALVELVRFRTSRNLFAKL